MLGFLLVAACILIGNCAQFERDLKKVRDLHCKRSKKISGDKLCQNARLSLNHEERGDVDPDSRVAAAAAKWEAMGCHRSSPAKRKTRSDLGGKHKKRARLIPPHLKTHEVDAMSDNLVQAVEELNEDANSDSGEEVVVGNMISDCD